MLALGAAVLVMATGCQTPIDPDNRPTVPAGVTNGELTTTMLVQVTPGCSVYRTVAPALRGLLAAAAADGVVITPTSCYRDYAGQVAARDYWCGQDACQMAAVPGTSNHGWGKAVDLGGRDMAAGFDSPGYRWLVEKAWIFGFNHPRWAQPDGSAPEPWHWEWVGDGGTKFPGVKIGPQS
jgi:hypothetical protein